MVSGVSVSQVFAEQAMGMTLGHAWLTLGLDCQGCLLLSTTVCGWTIHDYSVP